MTQAIIFDKDGTLFSFTRTWAPWCAALMRDLTRDEDHARALARSVGFDLTTGRYAANSPVIAGTPDVSADLMLPLLTGWTRGELIAHMIGRPVTPAPVMDLRALATALQGRDIRLAVMTNDSEGAAREQLAHLNVADCFDAIIGYDSGHGAKPDAAPLLACADLLGASAAQCLMVGDSLHDIHAGQAAGMRTLGVLTGIADARTLSVADAVLPDISHLPGWLNPPQG